MSEFLTVDEVASRLRTTRSSLYNLRHRNIAPGNLAVRVGRRLLWRESDLDAWWAAAVDRQLEEAVEAGR